MDSLTLSQNHIPITFIFGILYSSGGQYATNRFINYEMTEKEPHEHSPPPPGLQASKRQEKP